ncbi:MAG: Cna B-type domain-containing protein, partial [Bacilli bacterium]|nr:Cna B-type domain-containing protein [Bacilli bacterium]
MSKNKKTSKILYSICFVFLSALSILGLVKALDDGGKIEISKKATKIYGEDNNNLEYGRKARVTLDVNALPYNESTTTNGKLDVILILDRSGSMSEGVNGENDHTEPRLNLVKEASDNFIDTIMSKNNNVKLGVVDYSTEVSSHDMTTDKNIALGYNDNLEASGATNIQEAIYEARNLLDDQGRDDAKKIIILLTDGIPTKFRYNGKTYGTGYGDDSVFVGITYDTILPSAKYMRPSEAAKNELDTFKSSYPKADVYTITFGNESEAANKLQTINPEEKTKDHVYENTLSLNAEELNKKFQSITESIQNVIGKNAVVTDIIPNTFELTESSIKDLESKGVNIVTNSKGEQVLTWNIGNINANNKITLEYEVIAKNEFHGNMFTNTNAVLNVEVSDNNPYYEGTKQTLTFEKPTVEIPAITNNDSYKTNSSYITKEGETLTGTTILNNDINKQILANKNNADVDDEIIIIENENTVKKEDGSYELYKNKEFYGVLTLNSDGTFNFESIKGQTGEISFDYKIKSNIKNGSETDKVYSNISTVTLNILEIEKTTISGTKTWVDDNNRDGLRPDKITVYLYANGKEFDKKIVSEETNWSYEFKDLYTEEHDKKIVYEVREEKVKGYDSEVLENGNIINTHDVEKTSVSGTKTWVDDNNRDGIRPDNIIVNLYANGSKIDSKKVSIDNNWKYTFDDLYKKENGKVIEYSVIEETISGYNTSYDGFNITNTHESEKININVSKEWINKDNIYNHPDNV